MKKVVLMAIMAFATQLTFAQNNAEAPKTKNSIDVVKVVDVVGNSTKAKTNTIEIATTNTTSNNASETKTITRKSGKPSKSSTIKKPSYKWTKL